MGKREVIEKVSIEQLKKSVRNARCSGRRIIVGIDGLDGVGKTTLAESLSWTWGGEPSGNINFRMPENSIELIYIYRNWGEDEWQDVKEHVPFAFTAQNFGGQRRWLECHSCRRKCSVLYGGTHYRCRKCWNTAYQSQNESPHFRALSQAQKYRRRIGGSECTFDPFPEKPKGMHWRTYNRIRESS